MPRDGELTYRFSTKVKPLGIVSWPPGSKMMWMSTFSFAAPPGALPISSLSLANRTTGPYRDPK